MTHKTIRQWRADRLARVREQARLMPGTGFARRVSHGGENHEVDLELVLDCVQVIRTINLNRWSLRTRDKIRHVREELVRTAYAMEEERVKLAEVFENQRQGAGR